MEKPLSCKYCEEKELIFHDSLSIFNPETDEYEDIKDVYECTSCGTLYFEQGEFFCMQMDGHSTKSNNLHIGESK